MRKEAVAKVKTIPNNKKYTCAKENNTKKPVDVWLIIQ